MELHGMALVAWGHGPHGHPGLHGVSDSEDALRL